MGRSAIAQLAWVGVWSMLVGGGRADAQGQPSAPQWFRGALPWDTAPVDLSFLNSNDKPAGQHGFIKVDGDRLVFEDGTPARFWGANLSGPVLFLTPRETIPRQAKRIAQLGYNLIRIVQHDSDWVNPNIFGMNYTSTRYLDRKSLSALDYWIKCLKDEGIYVWLDMHWRRPIKPADGVRGFNEIAAKKGIIWGYNYVNPDLMKLMKEFQHQYLNHVNYYTRLAYKNDPAVVGVLLTNENDLTVHFGVSFLPGQKNPVHKGLFDRELQAFAKATGLPGDRLSRSWEPGPAMYFLSDLEHRFNRMMIDDLRADGVRAPIATSNFWSPNTFRMLTSLSEGDVIDVHSYGESESLSTNPHQQPNFLASIAPAQIYGKPVSITEWNVPFPKADRFIAPLYLASIASLQGWDMPMLYNYSQTPLQRPGPEEWSNEWSTFCDPAISGIMPAAAVAFRQGHISSARTTYCLKLSPEQLLGTDLEPKNTATVRTLVEQSRLTIGIPAVKELPWLKPSEPSKDVTIVTDPNRDFIPTGQYSVRSDTGELARDWKDGIQTIDTPRTQAVSGGIGSKVLELKDATFELRTKKAVVALTSIDNQPLSSSRFIMVTAIGQARRITDMGKKIPITVHSQTPFVSEPVIGKITLRTKISDLDLLSLGPASKVVSRMTPAYEQGSLTIALPAGRGTHWYVLKARPSEPVGKPSAPSANP